jgi:hypothetical protein
MHCVFVGLGEVVLGTSLALLKGGRPNKQTSDSKLKRLHALCLQWCRLRRIPCTAEQFSLRLMFGGPNFFILDMSQQAGEKIYLGQVLQPSPSFTPGWEVSPGSLLRSWTSAKNILHCGFGRRQM